MAQVLTIEGTNMRYDPIDDYFDDSFGAFDVIMTPEQLRASVIAAGAGAAGILGASLVLQCWQPEGKLAQWAKPIITTLAGMAGGRLLWDMNRDAATAVVGSIGGLGLAALVVKLAGAKDDGSQRLKIGLDSPPAHSLYQSLVGAPALASMPAPEELELRGLGMDPRQYQFADAYVEQRQSLGDAYVEQRQSLGDAYVEQRQSLAQHYPW